MNVSARQAFDDKVKSLEWTRTKVDTLEDLKVIFGNVILAEVPGEYGQPTQVLVVGTRVGNVHVYEKDVDSDHEFKFHTAHIPESLKHMNLIKDKQFHLLSPRELDVLIGVTGLNIGEVLENQYLMFKKHDADSMLKSVPVTKMVFVSPKLAAQMLKNGKLVHGLAPTDMMDVAASVIHQYYFPKNNMNPWDELTQVANFASIIREAVQQQQSAEEAGLSHFVKDM